MASKAWGFEAVVEKEKSRVVTWGLGIVLRVTDVRTPKVDPPPWMIVSYHIRNSQGRTPLTPLIAQNRSVFWHSFAMTMSPPGVTSSISKTWSAAMP